MSFKRRHEIANARPSNEGKNQVDSVGGVNLCLDLAPDTWLAASIGHEDGVA